MVCLSAGLEMGHRHAPRIEAMSRGRLGRRKMGLPVTFRIRLFSTNVRLNQVNVQLLYDNLQKAVFPSAKNAPTTKLNEQVVELSKAHLLKHELPIDQVRPALPEVPFEVPRLQGHDIEEHFWQLGSRLGWDYYRLADEFAKRDDGFPAKFGLDHFRWNTEATGWSRYDVKTGEWLGACAVPQGKVLVFDVESCFAYQGHKAPILAVAYSDDGSLYVWISPAFCSESGSASAADQLVLMPLGEASSEQLCIGHNVSFDRARVAEEYAFELGKRRYLDTLSMHSAVAGISSQQRITWTKYKKDNLTGDVPMVAEEVPSEEATWCDKGSMANLVDTVRLHCDGLLVDKGPRELLVKETDPGVIRASLPTILTYCANDVAATTALYRSLWPKWLGKCPHPVTFTAMLEMCTAYLPVDERWQAYYDRCEAMLSEAKEALELALAECAEAALRCPDPQADPWLSRLDWTPAPARYTKAKYLKDGSYAKGGEPRPIGDVALFGKPAWYRKLYNRQLGRAELTTKARIVPYLLRMTWQGRPVHFIESHGWCYAEDAAATAGTTSAAIVVEGRAYCKIPHAKEQGANVGSLLSKDFLAAFEKGVLKGDDAIVQAVLKLNSQFSFWTGYRERIRDQLVVQNGAIGRGVILPQCIPMGTVTRRAVEATWMTASNPKASRVGSELKSLVHAPEGWSIVGADVDSQELWIASLLGDAQFGFAGSTPIGWMTLQGAKADGSDLHSRTAKLLGMTRDAAKIFTYGRIYGAGAKYAASLLQKYDPSLSAEDAARKARELYQATKGRRLVQEGLYQGGSESLMFNQLEAIARAPVSRTPALSAAISDALLSTSVNEDYLTSRVNWAVQSSGVDYLHMLLVAMQYLTKAYAIPGRLLLTIHDEVRYLVPQPYELHMAACLQVANLWTRAMFVHRVGMAELPLGVAFFSAVDLDRVLRKEPTIGCQTPSQPEAIPPGRSIDVWQLLRELPAGGLTRPSGPFKAWWEARRGAVQWRPSEPAIKVAPLASLRRQTGLAPATPPERPRLEGGGGDRTQPTDEPKRRRAELIWKNQLQKNLK